MSERDLIDTNSIDKLDQTHIIADLNALSTITGAIMECDHTIDVRDPKWSRPEYADSWFDANAAASACMFSQDLPMEEKLSNADASIKAMLEMYAQPVAEGCEVKEYLVPGCPEEPDTQAKVLVYTPETAKKRNNRALFYIIAGALVTCEPSLMGLEGIAMKYNAVLVTVVYRTSLKATYPAAINDCHAGYQWMVEHADELAINPDKVVIMGNSSGGHLSLSLGFRIKRYGFKPRGIVAVAPQTDCPSAMPGAFGAFYGNGIGDAICQHDFLAQYLGRNAGNPMLGPEALPNYATVEDCIGYPPCVIHTSELDSDCNEGRKFYGKLLNSKSFAEFHCWGGLMHGAWIFGGTPVADRFVSIMDGNVNVFFDHDFRRPWVVDEYREMINAKLDAMS